MRLSELVLGATLSLLALSASVATPAWAKVPEKRAQQLIEQCQQKARRHSGGGSLEGLPLMEETNAQSYTPGESFELHINFLGHGNTVHNVTCKVDAQGNVSFKNARQTGSTVI